jgi:hypothetical protein
MSSTDRNHDFVCCEQIENMILNVVNRGGNWEAVHRLTVNALNKCPLVLIGFALKSAELQAQLCKHIYIYIYIYINTAWSNQSERRREGRAEAQLSKAELKPSYDGVLGCFLWMHSLLSWIMRTWSEREEAELKRFLCA